MLLLGSDKGGSIKRYNETEHWEGLVQLVWGKWWDQQCKESGKSLVNHESGRTADTVGCANLLGNHLNIVLK